MRKQLSILLSVSIFLFLSIGNPANAGIGVHKTNTTQVTLEGKQRNISTKKQKRRKAKQNKPTSKAVLAAILGTIGIIAFPFGLVSAYFAASIFPAVLGFLLAIGLGIAAIVLAIKALKKSKAEGKKVSAWVIIGTVLGAIAIALASIVTFGNRDSL